MFYKRDVSDSQSIYFLFGLFLFATIFSCENLIARFSDIPNFVNVNKMHTQHINQALILSLRSNRIFKVDISDKGL